MKWISIYTVSNGLSWGLQDLTNLTISVSIRRADCYQWHLVFVYKIRLKGTL